MNTLLINIYNLIGFAMLFGFLSWGWLLLGRYLDETFFRYSFITKRFSAVLGRVNRHYTGPRKMYKLSRKLNWMAFKQLCVMCVLYGPSIPLIGLGVFIKRKIHYWQMARFAKKNVITDVHRKEKPIDFLIGFRVNGKDYLSYIMDLTYEDQEYVGKNPHFDYKVALKMHFFRHSYRKPI
jgi:hypothetical protein